MYEALKQHLPEGWRAWHSLRLRDKSVWEGEGDFVLAIPARGLLVLEVKGGWMELRDGHWHQNGQRLSVAPRDQGLRFARHLVDVVSARTAERPPFGVLTVFPDVDFTQPPATGDLREVVLGRRDLSWLGEALQRAVENAIPPYPAPPSNRWLQALHELWGETWVPHVRLDDRVEDAERRAVALNADQLRALDVAEENERALVTGAAGTGKTIVAAELCRRWALRGKRALFLCFTDALARAVDRQFERDFKGRGEKRPRALSLRKYAVSLLQAVGVTVRPTTPESWGEVALQAACEALPDEAERPDLVVVDEAQDLEDSDWALVEELSDGRALWVFHDPLQAYWTDRHLPPFVVSCPAKLRLPRQMRSPESVERFARLYAQRELGAPADSIRQVDPSVLQLVLAGPDEVLGRVQHLLTQLRASGARPADIAIVSLGGQLRSQLFGLEELGSHRLVHADSPEAGANVVSDTFLRFKGLERPFVIVTGLDVGLPQYDVRMHIALTRATVGLTILCAEEQRDRDARLALLLKRRSTERG